MTKTWYETSSGETFDLSGVISGLDGTEHKGWSLTRSGRAYERQMRTCGVTISFVASGADGRESAMRMFELCDLDAMSGTPGRLHVGEWYLTCYVIGGDLSVMDRWHASYQVTLASDDPVWVREHSWSFMPSSGEQISNEQLDFSFDYAHDYGARQSIGSSIVIPGFEPCDVKITVYGYAVSPYVRIGSNVHQVNVTVPDGGLLIIDTTKRASMAGDSIVLKDMYGNSQNVFSKRLRGSEGSGTYVYQKAQPGETSVTWQQSFGFDLVAFERRGRLPWT